MADKKRLSPPPLDKKWLLGPAPLEPLPPGPHCKRWYRDKDKLHPNYLAKHRNRLLKCPTALDSRRWVFVREGLDDFRTGCPPGDNLIIRGPREGFLPTIAHRVPRPPPRKTPQKVPKGTELLSRLLPAQQARKAFVEQIEASLAQHPLAHYPDLKHSLPADLLGKVLEELDPDRKLEDTWAYCEHMRDRKKSPTKLCAEHPDEATPGPSDQITQKPPKEPFLSYLMKLFPEEKKKKKPRKKGFPKGLDLYRNVRREVREFCRWIDAFGDMGIDEEFIMKQLKTDYTFTPTYTTSKIKKVTELPLELSYSKQLADDTKKRKFSLQEGNWERKLRKPPDPYKRKPVKIRYGAWYLNPKTWKKLINDEPLIDPKVLQEEEYWHYGRHLEPDIIDDLYGPIAFKDFIMSKGYKMPGVLQKMFFRKKWTEDSVKTPIHRVMKLLSKVPDDTEEDD